MIFDRMAPQYGPRQDFGMRYQDLGERAMDFGMGRERFDIGGGVLGGRFRLQTGGQLPPSLPPMSTPTPPTQANPWMTGGNTPPQFMGPQSSLGRWFSAYRMGAYR